MSKLFHTEQGLCSYLQYEAVSARRRVRKELVLPDRIHSGGVLYLLAKPYAGCRYPLQVQVNDYLATIAPADMEVIGWQALDIPQQALRPGANTIELWSDNTALDGWAIGMESGYQPSGSWLSVDNGESWHNQRMGISHSLSGEYIIRLRVNDPALRDHARLPFIWESPDCLLFDAVREAIPTEIRAVVDPWERARALAAWVSVQWKYRNTNGGIEYAPWDALTILAWGRAERGMVHPNPVVMCVQFGIVFTTCALALGLPARSICCKGSGLYDDGHFISEVWSERWQKWCQVDANTDVVYIRDGVPLSVAELATLGAEAEKLAVTGPGYAAQSDYIKKFVKDSMFSGKVYEHWAVWPRNDYLSHLELTPPTHGSTSYVETDWQWAEPAKRPENLAMFPYQAPAAELAAAPPTEWRAVTAGV